MEIINNGTIGHATMYEHGKSLHRGTKFEKFFDIPERKKDEEDLRSMRSEFNYGKKKNFLDVLG